MIKHYVEFDTPGVFLPETEVRLVRDRIPAHLSKIPRYTYAIEFFDREEAKRGGETLLGKAKNRSRRIILGAVYKREQLPSLGFDKHTPLYRNSENTNGKVIKCITGNWQPWDRNWIILENYKELKTLINGI